MQLKITPSKDKKKLAENLKAKVEDVEINGEKIIAETKDPSIIERTPGVEKFEVDGEETPGLKGRPVQEKAYAKIESKKDAVKALLATTEGYDLVVLDSSREWDMRNLKKYNPNVKQLKSDTPKEVLGIEKTISDIEKAEGLEKIKVEMPENEEDMELIYREMLT